MIYVRPLVQAGPHRPDDALPLAGTRLWFAQVVLLERGRPPQVVAADVLEAAAREALTAPRAPLAGLALERPRIMAILNATPDSFSDGGLFAGTDAALTGARQFLTDGADILDIGGESTRPGAVGVPESEEIARTAPVIAALGGGAVISIDTRKAAVARAALDAGAAMLNDVTAMTYDAAMAPLAARSGAPICLMHSGGPPETMQDDPRYDDVVLDVYDHLAARRDAALAAGIARDRIVLDPGIGFGKTLEHNLALLSHLSLYHSLGCPLLLGASRKRFIGTLGDAPQPRDRAPGSIAVALAGLAQGVQILRVHDMAPTRQAVRLWQAATFGDVPP